MTMLHELPFALRTAVERETRGEAIRWIGRPRPRAVFARTTAAWLIGVPWSALTFGIFGSMVAVLVVGKPPTRVVPAWEYLLFLAMTLFTGAFALVGLALLLSPFLAWWKARHTAHVITDQRLLTVSAGRTVGVTSHGPGEILSLDKRQRADGSGSLKVVTGFTTDSDGDRLTLSEHLVAVEDVAKAEVLLRQLQARRHSA